jgi:hypothetical protein
MRARVVTAGLVVIATLLVVRVGAAPAETCPAVSTADTREAAERAVEWLGTNQRADGSFAYQLDETGDDLGGYNITRHAGVLLSLYQATAAGIDGAHPIAERGLEWAAERIVPAGDGRAFGDRALLPTGASALLTSALVERRDATGDDREDALIDDLVAFLAGAVEPSGAVAESWDTDTDRAVPGRYSVFFTGEVMWALARVDHPAADVVASYMPRRDDVEDRFPPTSDHWAAYAWAEFAASNVDLTDEQHAFADRQAGIFGLQVRGESTRWEAGGLVKWMRRGPAGGSGLGTLGEGSAALLRYFGPTDAPDGLARRTACVAGMLVARQAQGPGPAQRGAWFTDGVTRMDDQQHAMSALLASGPALEATGADGAVGGGEDPWGVLVVGLALLAATNPARLRSPRRGAVGVAIAAVAAAVVLAAASGPIADSLSSSPASVRLAAGAVLGLVAIVGFVVPRGSWEDGLTIAGTAVVALAAGIDDGVLTVGTCAVLVAVAGVWLPDRWRRPLIARPLAAVGVVVAAGIAANGVLGV